MTLASGTNLTLLSNTTVTTSNPITLSGSGAFAVMATGAATLDSVALGTGALTVTAAGIGQQAGSALTGSGRRPSTPGANAIALTSSSNGLTGLVSLNNSGANNVAFTTNGALQLDSSSLGSGTLAVTAAGPSRSSARSHSRPAPGRRASMPARATWC
ncbi:MAG: hypothetical protein WDO24_14910 [Pseudomonadota bacterium]